jgi:hypothetical protein
MSLATWHMFFLSNLLLTVALCKSARNKVKTLEALQNSQAAAQNDLDQFLLEQESAPDIATLIDFP